MKLIDIFFVCLFFEVVIGISLMTYRDLNDDIAALSTQVAALQPAPTVVP